MNKYRVALFMAYNAGLYLLNDTVTANCGQYNKVIGRLVTLFAFVVYLFSVFLKHFCLLVRVLMCSPTH